MRGSLDAGDWKILILAAVLLLALVGATMMVSPPAQDPFGLACSRSPAPTGAKATFLLLQSLGYRLIRWQRPEAELPPPAAGAVLVLAGPMEPFSRGARQAVRDFAGAGGTVLTTGDEGARLVPDGEAGAGERLAVGWRTYPPLVPSPLARGAPEIVMAPQAAWAADRGEQLAIYGDDEAKVVVTSRKGKGRFIWWASSTPLSNAGLREKGNLALLLGALGPAGRTVIWDEYSHGHRGSLLGYVGKTPLPWAVAQAALLAIAVCLTFARRSGPVRRPFTEARLSPLEFVDTLGDLYLRARAAPAAVGLALQRCRLLLARRLALPAAASPGRLCAAARERLGAGENLLGALRSAERATLDFALDDAQALRLVQELHDEMRALGLAPPFAQEPR